MDTKKHTLTEAQKQAREKANPAELKALGIRVEPAPASPTPGAPRRMLEVHFGAIAAPLAKQLAGFGLSKKQISLWQNCADSVTLLNIQGYIPDATVKAARRKIFREIDSAARKAGAA